MKRALLSLLLVSLLASPAFAGGTITWPAPPLAAGESPTTTPIPKIDWVDRVVGMTAKAHKMPQLDLIFDGDSITDGWQGGGRDVWAQHYAKLNAFDFGISGDRTEHVLWRLQNGQVEGLHPKLVMLMIGTNDIGDTVDQIADGVKAVVAEYRKRCPDAVIVVQAIFPRAPSGTDPVRAKIKSINQILAKLDDGKNIIFIDFGDKFLAPDGSITKDIMGDALHPTAKGYQIWADAIQPTIDKYFPQPK